MKEIINSGITFNLNIKFKLLMVTTSVGKFRVRPKESNGSDVIVHILD